MIEDEFARLAMAPAGQEPPDPEEWSFDVITALHDHMKLGAGYPTKRSRVVVSRAHYPKWTTAAEVAGCMAAIRHGGMPIEILPRY